MVSDGILNNSSSHEESYVQLLRDIKESPRNLHEEVARGEIIHLEAENTRLKDEVEELKNEIFWKKYDYVKLKLDKAGLEEALQNLFAQRKQLEAENARLQREKAG